MPANTNLILQAAQGPRIGQAFSSMLNNIGKLDAIKQQREQAPIRNQLLQQQFDAGSEAIKQAKIKTGAEGRKESIQTANEIGQRVKSFLGAGNVDGAKQFLNNELRAIASINPESGMASRSTLQRIQVIQRGLDHLNNGNVEGLLTDIDNVNKLANQQQGRGQGSEQRRHNELVRIVQDPNSTQIEKDSANRALGNKARATGAAAKTVDVGGVPHVFDPVKQTLVPAVIEGEKVTGESVGKSKKTIAQAEAFGRASGANRVKRIDKGFEAVTKIDQNIANLEKSISVIKEGANSGPFVKLLPTFKSATKELEQIQGELALDVVGSVAFGALSQGELDLAKQIGLPDLPPEKLKDWAVRKIAAQKKVRAEMMRQIQHLDGGGSIASYFRKRAKELGQGSSVQDKPLAEDRPSPQDKGQGEIMIDANGNRARVFSDGTFEEL